MRKKFVLFDFDGVIVDSFQAAMEVNGLIYSDFTEDDYRKQFEGNVNDESARWGDRRKSNLDFFTEYAPKLPKQKIFHGMIDVIVSLGKKYNLIIISSTTSNLIKNYLEIHKLDHNFTEIWGNDIHKSKTEKIKMVFEKYETDAQNCIFITDTLGDIKEAKEAGVKSIAVSWGFNGRELLEKGNPLVIVDQPEEIEKAAKSHFAD